VRHELLHHNFLSALAGDRDGFGVGDDDFLEVVDEVAVNVVSRADAANGHLPRSIGTEYSRESPSRVSPYVTLWATSLGSC
jgi:hypothetical protein